MNTYFITVDGSNHVTGIYCGECDTIYRHNGQPTPDAIQIPAGAVQIGETDRGLVEAHLGRRTLVWDGASVSVLPADERQMLTEAILKAETKAMQTARAAELAGKTLSQLNNIHTGL